MFPVLLFFCAYLYVCYCTTVGVFEECTDSVSAALLWGWGLDVERPIVLLLLLVVIIIIDRVSCCDCRVYELAGSFGVR